MGYKQEDVEGVLNWLRSNSMDKDDSLDPSCIFRKLHSSLPAKKNQPLEERAQDIVNAISWMRKRGLITEDEADEMKSTNWSNMSHMANITVRTPEERSKDFSDALNWLRN